MTMVLLRQSPHILGTAITSQRLCSLKEMTTTLRSWIQGTPTAQYTAGGAGAAVDGIEGDTDWRKGHWIGIQGEDAILEISLERT